MKTPIPADDAATSAAYRAHRRACLIFVYASSPEEKAEIARHAQDSGYGKNVSGYCLLALRHYQSGRLYPPGHVERLERELARLREWHEKDQEKIEDYRTQIKALQAARETAVVLLAGLPNGAELAKRLLPQATQGATA